ncbi:hypothetical protein O4220_23880 [Rhodococcus ruber]|uniref:CN hydrolase domain-containing protein n=1 Tax=Rhodococcus ruber TaxID=1830 RepID=A0ABT4MNH7_9NOCA|nr:nitrilase-related carbon-nitrogen hydrolase [Rhodococcus ruber]MCZ4521570.1 hypothetical protein [Rhodococcus ruber]
MKIAALQATGLAGEPDLNLAVLREAARQAVAEGADVLVTPELYVPGYAPEQVRGSDGSAQRTEIGVAAAQYGIHIVASTVELTPSGSYISASLFDPTGGEVTRYRKQNLFGSAEESSFERGREDPELFDLNGFRAALGICFDIEFPEFVRKQSVRGATLLLVPTAVPLRVNPDGSPPALDTRILSTTVIPTRAFESQLYIVYANQCGPRFSGTSTIADPYGSRLATAGDDPALIFADISPAVVDDARRDVGYMTFFA